MNSTLVSTGLQFVLLSMVLIIGVAVVAMTYETTGTQLSNTTFLNTVYGDLQAGIETLTGFIPVLVIALVAGLAIAYFMGIFGNRSDESSR